MVGVDIGSTVVRAVVAGRIRSPQAVSLSLVSALHDAGVPRYGFVLGLTSSHVGADHDGVSFHC